MTRCTKHVLSKGCMHANKLLPWIARRRDMSYKWGVHQHIFEKSNMFNSFLSLQNLFSSNGLVNVDKLIFGACTLNANVPLLLMISNKMVADINVLCSCILNRIVGELYSTLIVT